MVSVLFLYLETVVVEQRINLLREKHPQVEGNWLLLTGHVITEVPHLMTYLCGGVVAHSFGNSDSALGLRIFIFRNCKTSAAAVERTSRTPD
jgi:hypothetical protein